MPARLRSGRICYVDLRSAFGRGVLITGGFDAALTNLICSEVRRRPGAFIDAGANIGYFSLLALDLDATEVHAFEVDPRSLRCLRLTRERNGLENLRIHECAIGDRSGGVHLALQPEFGHTYVDLQASNGSLFPMRTLDSFRTDFRAPISMMKLDVEGAELAVLRGGEGILREYHPLVVSEVIAENLARFGNTDLELIDYMRSLGYTFTELAGANDRNLIFSAS